MLIRETRRLEERPIDTGRRKEAGYRGGGEGDVAGGAFVICDDVSHLTTPSHPPSTPFSSTRSPSVGPRETPCRHKCPPRWQLIFSVASCECYDLEASIAAFSHC